MVGDDHIPITIVQMDYVIFLMDAAQQVPVRLHRSLVIDMIGDVLSLHQGINTQGPFHF